LTTKNGEPIVSQGDDTILLPTGVSRFTVDQEGLISAKSGDNVQTVGRFKVVRFENPADLVKEGNGLYKLTNPDAQAIETEDTKIIQGFIENSNVSAVEEMTKMIETVRTFEAYQKIIQSIDEADSQAVNSIARLA